MSLSSDLDGTRHGGAPFVAKGEMAARVHALDWAATTMGPIESWPQSLRGTIKTLLGSRYAMILLWGPERIQIYNDAYTGLIGNKHPAATSAHLPAHPINQMELPG